MSIITTLKIGGVPLIDFLEKRKRGKRERPDVKLWRYHTGDGWVYIYHYGEVLFFFTISNHLKKKEHVGGT